MIKNTIKYKTTVIVPVNIEALLIMLVTHNTHNALGSCQAHYQVLMIILPEDFIIVNTRIVNLALNTILSYV